MHNGSQDGHFLCSKQIDSLDIENKRRIIQIYYVPTNVKTTPCRQRSNLSLFEPTVMFFGLCNALATFQAFVNDIFTDLIREWKVVVYLDDILIFAEMEKELEDLMTQVFEILQVNHLFIKPEKSKFNIDVIKFLGHIIR